MNVFFNYQNLRIMNLDVFIIGENGVGKHWLLQHIADDTAIEKVDCQEWRSSLNILSKIVTHKVNIFHFSYIDNLDPEGQLVLLRTLEKRELIFNECSFKGAGFGVPSGLRPAFLKDLC